MPGSLKKLGTDYGGWIIPTDRLNEGSVCYLAGAGEDISFDVLVAGLFHCDVYIFDPTPRAKKHFERVVASASGGDPITLYGKHRYAIDEETARHLHFKEIGIWKKADQVRFFAPKDETHVSHSISNLQETESWFLATVERLSDIMRRNGHQRIDLLKLDIEGAEFEVIDTILEDKLPIGILCVEFHAGNGDLDPTRAAVKKLEDHGYAVVARENLDFTFVNLGLPNV
jgi:FkbM family methyltransferase